MALNGPFPTLQDVLLLRLQQIERSRICRLPTMSWTPSDLLVLSDFFEQLIAKEQITTVKGDVLHR